MTMTNAEWCIKNGYKLKDILFYKNYTDDESWDYRIEISKANVNEHVKGADHADALLRWLAAEHVEPILNDVERKYLSAVIKPFRKHVKYIRKSGYGTSIAEFIMVDYKPTIENTNFFYLPAFKAGTMYKGMEFGRKYTLEELGL